MKIKKRINIRNIEQLVPINTAGITGKLFVQYESANLPNPEVVAIIDGAVKLRSDPRGLNTNEVLEFFTASNAVTETVAETQNIISRVAPATKRIFKVLALTVATTLIFGIGLHLDKKYNDGKIGKMYRGLSAFGVADAISSGAKDIETRIYTNDHPIYTNEDFIDIQENFNDDHGTKIKFKNIFWYVGNGKIVMRELIRDQQDHIVLLDFDDAADFCDSIGGYIPFKKDLDDILMGKISKLTDFVLPVKAERTIPEWTSTELDGDHYYTYMKGATIPPENAVRIGKAYGAEEDDSRVAFRCVVSVNTFISD